MDELQTLKNRVETLEGLLASFIKSDRYVFQKDLELQDGRNIQLARGTGTKIGLSALEKMGFYGATPVDQPATIADASGCDGDADDKVNLVIDRLQELGLIA